MIWTIHIIIKTSETESVYRNRYAGLLLAISRGVWNRNGHIYFFIIFANPFHIWLLVKVSIALAGYFLGLSRHFGAELSVWALRGLMQQIAYQITLSWLIVIGRVWWFFLYGISYHSMKQYRILHENLTKFPAKAIQIAELEVPIARAPEAIWSIYYVLAWTIYYQR